MTHLQECLVCEIAFGNKKCIISLLYRSPSQSSDDFNLFLETFEEVIDNVSNKCPYISLSIWEISMLGVLHGGTMI